MNRRSKPSDAPRYAPFPFFLAYAAAVLEADDFDVKVIDAVPLNLSTEEFIARAVACSPEVVFLEPATVSINHAFELCRILKEKTGALIVIGGPHASANAESTLEHHTCVDYALVGEYEVTLLNLLQALRQGQTPPDIAGLACRGSSGKVHGNGRSAILDPIDQLPFPARHLFPSYFNDNIALYHDGFCQGRPAVQLHSSRGCPFRCGFCAIQRRNALSGNRLLRRT